MDIEHASNCGVWEWVVGERTLNNTRACTCGLRARQAAKVNDTRSLYQHGVIPLGMSDDEFLRTLKIKPEEAE